MIASEKDDWRTGAKITNREGKNAVEMFDAIRPLFFVEAKNNFCVGIRVKAVAFALQFVAKVSEIVDLAVVSDEDGPITIGHRHVAISGKIENGKSTAAQTYIGAIGGAMFPQTGVVGAAMRLDMSHPGQRFPAATVHQSANAAHPLPLLNAETQGALRRLEPLN
jgi:hypothetical protein